jgi:N-acyl-phosphatidylethanolamine-hydrolysing phospholipase D
MHLTIPTRSFRSYTALSIFVCLGSIFLIQGCTFLRISIRNVPLLFRTPSPVNKLNRSEVPDGSRLSATWIGHATVLLQMDDIFILTDPVLTDVIGGSSKRLVEVGMDVQSIPPLNLVLISHRHMDHLSPTSLKLLGSRVSSVIVPPGVKADLPTTTYSVTELPAWEVRESEGLRITAVPVIHDGGRLIGDAGSHPKSFTGYLIQYHGLKVYFPGDTAYRADIFSSIFKRFGPIDLAIMPICPLAPAREMLPHHMNPSQAIQAANLLHTSAMAPIHFETFVNSLDGPGDCRQALAAAAADSQSEDLKIVHWQAGESIVFR